MRRRLVLGDSALLAEVGDAQRGGRLLFAIVAQTAEDEHNHRDDVRQNLVDLRKNEQAICLNGTYVHMNHMLAEGDVLTVWIRETENSRQIRPVKLPFAIVYEDEDLLVINKPAGMPVHPSRGNPENSLGNALAWYFKEQGVPFVFRCINRLDRDTSGLTIVAKHAVSAAILGQMVRAKAEQGLKAPGIHRTYLALVE